MISYPAPACSCCGAPSPDEKRIDARFGLPDAALAVSEEARHEVGVGALLRVDGVGSFIRCLLPVRLTDGIELVLGTWLEIGASDLEHAHILWEKPGYEALTLRGTLANAINPWGDALLGAAATVEVRDPDEIPYVADSAHPMLRKVLAGPWDRHQVLSCFGHALPVAVRTDLDDHWSVERSPGLEARVVDGVSQFGGPDRIVFAGLFTDDADRCPVEFLGSLLETAPTVPREQQLTEQLPDGIRHAFWLTEPERHELYGFTVHADGTAAGIVCRWREQEDLAWAQHVWRSARRSAPDEREDRQV